MLPTISASEVTMPNSFLSPRAPAVGDLVVVNASNRIVMWAPTKGPGSRKAAGMVRQNASGDDTLRLAILGA